MMLQIMSKAMKSSSLEKINKVISEKFYKKNSDDILLWLKDEKLGNYFLDKLPKEFDDLKEINFLLEELIKARNPYFALGILERSISEKNNPFIFQFLDKHIEYLVKKDNDNFGDYATDIVKKITGKFPEESEKAFKFVKKFIKVHSKEFADLRATREHGKQVISEIIFDIFNAWNAEGKKENIKKLIKLISENFNLIDDDYKFSMFTPEKIFSVIYEYIIIDFENNFLEIVNVITGQFKSKRVGHGKEWDGKDWSASGISQSGGFYSITDRHLVEKILAPAVKYFYENSENKDIAWEKLKEMCLVYEKDISPERPEFLNRAILPVVLGRYENCKGKEKNDAFGILKEFLEMTTLPDKSHLIFQYVVNSKINDLDKLNIAEASLDVKWNKKRLPANVFVEQVVSELVNKEDVKSRAILILEEWSKNKDYLERQNFGENNLLGIFSRLLSNEGVDVKREGIKLFEKYIYSGAFREKLERFDSFDIADKMALILDFDFEKGLEILWKVYGQEKLSENEQILICSGINKISKPEIRIGAYNEFLKKVLKGLENDINKIVEKFDHDYPRTAIVEFGDELAKEKKFKEALEIARIFIDDPDPRIDDKDDNLHERIEKGEEESAITSVRGWICWLLHQFPVLEGRDIIPEIIPLVKKLSKDSNYYVRSQACFPLAELMRVRNTVMPENREEFFLGREDAKKIEDIAFEMLRNKENHNLKAVMTNLAHVFEYMRSMNTKQAEEVLRTFTELEFTEPLERAASLFIFYAELRKDAFKEGILKDRVEKFDDSGSKRLLEDYLKKGKEEGRQDLLWKIMGLISESEKNPNFSYDKAFDIAYKYIKIIIEKYSPNIYSHVYRFIDDNKEKEYKELKELFFSCISKEQQFLTRNKVDKTWFPVYHHTNILNEIIKRKDNDEYLKAMEIISNYPEEYFSWREFGGAFHLKDFPKDNARVGAIFETLISKNPIFYDMKIKWNSK